MSVNPPGPPHGWLHDTDWRAWADASDDGLALTDPEGHILWCNDLIRHRTGLDTGDRWFKLGQADVHSSGTRQWHHLLLEGRHPTSTSDTPADHTCRVPADGTWRVDVDAIDEERNTFWVLRDATTTHTLTRRAAQLNEQLEVAQDFGHVGVWRRDIHTDLGHWDRRVFDMYGLTPSAQAPSSDELIALVGTEEQRQFNEDAYRRSTKAVGRYITHFRITQPNGSVRRVRSEWDIKPDNQGRPDRAVGVLIDESASDEPARAFDDRRQLTLALELGDMWLWRFDLKTERFYSNAAGIKALGLPPQDDGHPVEWIRERLHPDDRPHSAAAIEAALQGHAAIDSEQRYRDAHGQWRHYLVRRVAERTPSGEALGLIGVALDRTMEYERSARAFELARRYETATRMARLGIWNRRLGSEVNEWNATMFELFDTIERPEPPPFEHWLQQSIHADDRDRVNARLGHYLRHPDGAIDIEFRSLRRTGGVRHILMRANVVQRPGQDARIFGTAIDITELHAARMRLQTVGERTALIACHAGIGTWQSDAVGHPGDWDDQMFTLRGVAPGSVSTRSERMSLVHPDDRPHVAAFLDDLDPKTPNRTIEFRVLHPDGQCRWLAARSALLRDEEDKVIRQVGVNWDVTAARAAEEERSHALLAERENRAKTQFLTRMSHELRTPLNAVLGYTQLLLREARLEGAVDRATKLNLIRVGGEHLLALINDMIDMIDIVSAVVTLDMQAVNVTLKIDEALELIRPLANHRGISLHAGTASGVARVDPVRLRQILLNLLSNAVKYNRPEGHIWIESWRRDGQIQISVRDSGRGMQTHQLEHLFEPFNRLGMESEGIQGTGIGLSIVKGLVEAMGGSITARSIPGQGTEFVVTVAATDELPHPPGTFEPPILPRDERVIEVLYIEDNPLNLALMQELVHDLPWVRLTTQSSGSAGVAQAIDHPPDVALIDMELPDFNGDEVLRQLRHDSRTASVICIALSAHALPADIQRAKDLGFEAYWTKPIQYDVFVDALRRLGPGVTHDDP